MKRLSLILAAAAIVASCSKAVTVDHNISAEFPLVEDLTEVSVLFSDSGSADILIAPDGKLLGRPDGASVTTLPGGESLLRYKALALVWGTSSDTDQLLENSFWKEPALQWIYFIEGDSGPLEDCGFVDCFRARGLSAPSGTGLFSGSNVYDKLSAIGANPLSFTVRVKEAEL